MITSVSNYGVKIPNSTSYVKTLTPSVINNIDSDNNNNVSINRTFDLTGYVKSIIPSKNNGSFIKTFNNN